MFVRLTGVELDRWDKNVFRLVFQAAKDASQLILYLPRDEAKNYRLGEGYEIPLPVKDES